MPANRCAVPQRRRADRKDRVQRLACRNNHAIAFGNCKGILFMGECLSVERRGKISILTMIKPESMNAIGTHDDCQDIIDTLRILGDDRGVSAIILTGSGKAFSAGGNLKGMQDRTGIGVPDQPDSTRANYRKGVQAVNRALRGCEVPMIEAVNGHTTGEGKRGGEGKKGKA